MEIIKKQLGPEVSMDVELEGGSLKISLVRQSPSGSESVVVQESLKYFIDKEKDKLPAWAVAAIDLLEGVIP